MLHITLLWWVKSCISWRWHAQMNLRGVKFIFKIVLFAMACISSVCETLCYYSCLLFSFAFFFLSFMLCMVHSDLHAVSIKQYWSFVNGKVFKQELTKYGSLTFFVILISALAFGPWWNKAGHYLKAPHLLFAPASNRKKSIMCLNLC